MEKIKLIVAFEYMTRVRRLSFILTTIGFPILTLLAPALSIIFTVLGSGERHIMVLDQSGVPGLYEHIKKKIEGSPIGAKYTFSLVMVSSDQDIDQFRLKFNPEIEEDYGKVYLVLRRGILDGVSPEYYASSVGDFTLATLAGYISLAVTDQRLADAGLDPGRYLRPLTMKTIKVSSAGEAQQGAENIMASFIIFMYTFLAIIGYGSQVMFGVIEEKSTRIIEVLVSSAKPFEMMMGKLIGVGLVGLTQYAIWVIAAIPILFISQSLLANKGIALISIPISTLLSFIVYFVLGYFLFAAMYVVGGALITDSEDGNIVTRVMTVLTTVPLITVLAVTQDPNGPIALALSFIPFFTAGTMVLRMVMVSPPLWQILLSMFLMMATIGAVIWVAAKIYRVGILIYGKKPGLGEIVRWLRYT